MIQFGNLTKVHYADGPVAEAPFKPAFERVEDKLLKSSDGGVYRANALPNDPNSLLLVSGEHYWLSSEMLERIESWLDDPKFSQKQKDLAANEITRMADDADATIEVTQGMLNKPFASNGFYNKVLARVSD